MAVWMVSGGLLLSCSTADSKTTRTELATDSTSSIRDHELSAVVSVTASSDNRTSRSPHGDATAAGFITARDGLVVTSNQIVAGAPTVQVRFRNATVAVPATVIAASECWDLAVLQLPNLGFDYPTVDWSHEVAATAQPLDVANVNDTTGLDRRAVANGLTDGETARVSTPALITYDTPTTALPGGPVFNMAGEVVAVTTPYTADTSAGIPSWAAQPIVRRLARRLNVDSIGLNVTAVLDDQDGGTGLEVTAVRPRSIAAQAGLRRGDLILAMNGTDVGASGTLAEYCRIIRTNESGSMDVTVRRHNRTLELTLDTSTVVSSELLLQWTADPSWSAEPPVLDPFAAESPTAAALLREIGTPPGSRFVDTSSWSPLMYHFASSADRNAHIVWLLAIADRIGCKQVIPEIPFMMSYEHTTYVTCEVTRDGERLMVYAEVRDRYGDTFQIAVGPLDD
jgi:serine protease Do